MVQTAMLGYFVVAMAVLLAQPIHGQLNLQNLDLQTISNFIGPVNTQSAGSCVNAQNVIGSIAVCAIFGRQCGASSRNPSVMFVAQFAGQIQNSLGGLTNNPIICPIAEQACCLSNTVSTDQLVGLLNAAGGTNFISTLLGGQSQSGRQGPQAPRPVQNQGQYTYYGK